MKSAWMLLLSGSLLLISSPAALSAQEHQQHATPGASQSDDDLIASATSAAPPAVGENAAVVAVDEKGKIRTVRKGTNNFTCLPDGPSPGPDPMCVDKNGWQWLQAWLARKNPPADKVGFGYMLKGGSDASNEDPFATEPTAGEDWVDTGPHVMIFSKRLEGYPRTHADVTQPWVMFPGTPYEHVMVPVQ